MPRKKFLFVLLALVVCRVLLIRSNRLILSLVVFLLPLISLEVGYMDILLVLVLALHILLFILVN